MRSPIGRAMVAVRDSEIAATSLGINIRRTKTTAFGMSAGFCAIAGAIIAHLLGFVTPDQFGALIYRWTCSWFAHAGNAARLPFRMKFIIVLPEVLRIVTWATSSNNEIVGLRPLFEGLVVIAIMRFEPAGTQRVMDQGARRLRQIIDWDPSLICPVGQGTAVVTLLRVDKLSIEFGGIHAVKDVSFDVDDGEIVALIGSNGAGKTTVFNLLSRIYDPSAGRIVFKDIDATRVPSHRMAHLGLARTFQNIELFGGATVRANLLLGCEVRRQTNVFAEYDLFRHASHGRRLRSNRRSLRSSRF